MDRKGEIHKGLLFGGCGCAVLIAVIIGIIALLIGGMMFLQRQGPAMKPQQPIAPQVPTTRPTQPIKPTPQPQIPVIPQPQPPITQRPSGAPTPEEYYKLNQGEIVIVFAKGLTNDGLPVQTTREFSSSDPEVVEIIAWGPNTVTAGSYVQSIWYYKNTAVYTNTCAVKEGIVVAVDRIARPANGFPQGEYIIYVGVNGTPVLSHSFTVQ